MIKCTKCKKEKSHTEYLTWRYVNCRKCLNEIDNKQNKIKSWIKKIKHLRKTNILKYEEKLNLLYKKYPLW